MSRCIPLFSLLCTVLLLLSSCSAPEQRGRVLVLGIDGLDPQVVDLLVSEGHLPHFAQLREQGASAPLRSFKPLLSPILWTTIATGRTPAEHGIGHFVARSASGEELPVTSHMRRVESLWTLASDAGRRVSTVGWWATWPPERVNGTVVSDQVAYHFLFRETMEEQADAEAVSDPCDEAQAEGSAKTHPPELLCRIEPWLVDPQQLSVEDVGRFVDMEREQLQQAIQRPLDFERDLDHFRWALATARGYTEVGLRLWREDDPDLQLVYIEGTDSASHLFGHLFRAGELGGDLAEQQARFGRTVEQMYHLADEIVGVYMEELAQDPNATLVVLSDHGFELGALHDDPTRSHDLRRVSERFHREHGILYLWGRGVEPGSQFTSQPNEPTLLDITPTVLALLGLPASEEMPGRVLEEALTGIDIPSRVATYESASGERVDATGPAETGRDDRISQAQLEHLRSLGYLGVGGEEEVDAVSSPEGDRNLAAIHFQRGEYRVAAKKYHALVQAEPENPGLRASFAGVLGALERYDEALEQLDIALQVEPLHVEAYHNRAVILERQGNMEAALADYERALRYGPGYEPSLRAYRRLTGRAGLRVPSTAQEEQAWTLLEEASEAARRAQYERAGELLDQAEQLAPDFVLVHQYRANVAYLEGDAAGAAEALRRALELEPDNLLFQRNLTQLAATPEAKLAP